MDNTFFNEYSSSFFRYVGLRFTCDDITKLFLLNQVIHRHRGHKIAMCWFFSCIGIISNKRFKKLHLILWTSMKNCVMNCSIYLYKFLLPTCFLQKVPYQNKPSSSCSILRDYPFSTVRTPDSHTVPSFQSQWQQASSQMICLLIENTKEKR